MIAVETVINWKFITKSELAGADRQKLSVCRTGWTVIQPVVSAELQQNSSQHLISENAES